MAHTIQAKIKCPSCGSWRKKKRIRTEFGEERIVCMKCGWYVKVKGEGQSSLEAFENGGIGGITDGNGSGKGEKL